MKKILFTFIILVGFLNLNAQKIRTIEWYNWSKTTSYQLSATPRITGYGKYSDSLSNANNGIIFYVCNKEYYPINSWADYYLWYTNRFWYLFSMPELYEFYYITKDDYGMSSYIAGNSYQGKYYPSNIYISFGNKKVDYNKLDENSRYIAYNDKKLKKLKKQIKYNTEPKKKQNHSVKKYDLVKKTVYVNKPNKQNNLVKKHYKQPVKKEVKLNKYEHKTINSPVRYGNTNRSSTNSSRTSSNTQRTSSGNKTIK